MLVIVVKKYNKCINKNEFMLQGQINKTGNTVFAFDKTKQMWVFDFS